MRDCAPAATSWGYSRLVLLAAGVRALGLRPASKNCCWYTRNGSAMSIRATTLRKLAVVRLSLVTYTSNWVICTPLCTVGKLRRAWS